MSLNFEFTNFNSKSHSVIKSWLYTYYLNKYGNSVKKKKERFHRLKRQYIKGIGFKLNKICQWQQKMKLGANWGQQLEPCKGVIGVIASYK